MNLAPPPEHTLTKMCVCVFNECVYCIAFVEEDKSVTMLKVRQGREEWEKCDVGRDKQQQAEDRRKESWDTART